MRLILIRHGDPDYQNDGLTEKGIREAELLAKRVKTWRVDDVYTSPLGRAKATAQPCLKAWGKQAKILEWTKEFFFLIDDGKGGLRIPWDFYPSEWTAENRNFTENDWIDAPKMREIKNHYEEVCVALDEFLLGYGYKRRGRAYQAIASSEKTVVFFCHFGISMILLSHLLNLPAQALLHGLFLPPTSVTVLNTEERVLDEAYFRAERIGDCAHLIAGGERISESGYFTKIMQESVLKI